MAGVQRVWCSSVWFVRPSVCPMTAKNSTHGITGPHGCHSSSNRRGELRGMGIASGVLDLNTGIIFTSTPLGMRSIAISVSVCLFVCHFIRLFECLNNHTCKFCQFFSRRLRVICDHGSHFPWRQCNVLPVLWMTSCFHIMEGIGRIKDDTYVSSNSPGGGTGGKLCRLVNLAAAYKSV